MGRAPPAGRHAPPGGAGQMPHYRVRRRPRPLLVRAPCPSRCPRPGSGGMRDRPGHWRAGGRDPPVVRLPRARAAGRGHGTGGRHLRLDRHGRGRAVAPGTGGPLCGTGRGPVAIWREGSPSGLGPVRLRLMSDRAVTGAGPFGARFPRLPRGPDLTSRPGRPRSCRRGLAGVARWAPSSPLRAAVCPHWPSERGPDFFESYRSSWSPVTESNRRPSPYHKYGLLH